MRSQAQRRQARRMQQVSGRGSGRDRRKQNRAGGRQIIQKQEMMKTGSSTMEGNGDIALKSDDASQTETGADTVKTESEEDYPLMPPSTPLRPGPCPYDFNERVLAFYGSKIYEAKVVQVDFQIAEKLWVFKVHYMRWSNKLDEWVGVERLMKDTEANRHRQRVNNNKQDEEMQMKPGSHGREMTKRGSANTEGNDDLAPKSDDASKTETDADTTKSEEEYPSTPPSPPSPDPCPYNEKEKVLAFHGSKIYEAKVVQVGFQIAEKQWGFKVHYMRWSHKWDEWVGVDRLMKDTEANRHRQLVNNNKQDEEMQMKPSYHPGRGRKRKNNSRNQEKKSIQMENSVSIQIPPKLKKQLVGDCDFVKRLRKLVKLPREPNVNDILEEYRDYMTMIEEQASETTGEIVKGLRSYFDKALPAMLLYENEREQYEDAVATDVSPSSVYGAEHLLRLFVNLPELMVHTNIEEETLTLLQEKIVGFLKFLQNHRTVYFLWPVHDAVDFKQEQSKEEDD